VSVLRAKCPDCRTYTAVALGPDYECHACGRQFAAALVRVPRAWGDGGDEMVAAARLPLPYPEASVIEEDTLEEQTLAIAAELPERPLVLGGCCCSHVGAVEALSARYERLGLIWVDAHGDLNTPEEELIERIGPVTGVEGIDAALAATSAVYVAFDADVLDPGEIACFMPEPDGWTLLEAERVLRRIMRRSTVVGAGFAGLVPDRASVERLLPLCWALGL
jgi:arginase family enzyme